MGSGVLCPGHSRRARAQPPGRDCADAPCFSHRLSCQQQWDRHQQANGHGTSHCCCSSSFMPTHEQTLTQRSWLRSTTSRGRSRASPPHVFARHGHAAETPAAYSICCLDAFEVMSQPLTNELPHAIMDIIAADPTSSIALKYRSYVKTVLLPLCQRVRGILRAHSATIEVLLPSQLHPLYYFAVARIFSPYSCNTSPLL